MTPLYAKAARRLLPLLFIGYVVAYLNRVNVGFAKLQMMHDLSFSDTAYGLGAGIFFVGYFLFEVPSNILLHRLGARVWIARIMISWGIVSGAAALVRTPSWFYLSRFALGATEAGFFPGIILYLTYWFPNRLRARITGWFVSAIAFSGIVGGPLSGWIIDRFSGCAGFAGWQWLFVLEAVPSLLVGVVILIWLPNSIDSARWLSADEKAQLRQAKAAEESGIPPVSVGSVVSSKPVWFLATVYFTMMIGLYGVSFWMPQVIRDTGVTSASTIGLLSAIPYAFAVFAMISVGRFSDASGRRRVPTALSIAAGAVGVLLIALAGSSTSVALVGLTLAASGVLTSMPLFWTFPAAFLSGSAAAAGIALINSVGNLGGFISPLLLGALKDATPWKTSGLFCVAMILGLGALLIGLFGRDSASPAE